LIEYVPLLFWLVYRPLFEGQKDSVEGVCALMRDLNLSLECFKEHVLTLLMCGEDEDFNQLPVATRSLLTKAYNKVNKCSIKPVKRSRRDNDEFKVAHFDPDV
jgi:hypothetical protein